MQKLNIVLLEPQIPQNTGNIARTCSVTGSSLHLIEPLGFTVTDSKLKRAGLDYWNQLDIHYYRDIQDFYNKTEGNYYYFTTKADKFHSDIKYENNIFLIFGREDAGIPEEILLANHEKCCRIPMLDNSRSLNLSNSVAIAGYEVLRQWDYPNLKSNPSSIFRRN